MTAAINPGPQVPQPAAKKSRALWWILGGLAFLLALFALAVWLMMRVSGYFMAALPIKLDPAQSHIAQAEEKLKLIKNPRNRWYALGDAGMWALHQGRVEDAEKYGNELLAGIGKWSNWNDGNAVHKGNIILGRVALRRNDVAKAKQHLIAAGKTKGSPQLDTFGPNMTLAEELLKRGEKQVVLEYIDLCAQFWKMDNGAIAAWRSMINSDKLPSFGAHLLY
jgi:hypothetical protein